MLANSIILNLLLDYKQYLSLTIKTLHVFAVLLKVHQAIAVTSFQRFRSLWRRIAFYFF